MPSAGNGAGGSGGNMGGAGSGGGAGKSSSSSSSGKGSSSSGGNKSQGDTDKGSRDQASSSKGGSSGGRGSSGDSGRSGGEGRSNGYGSKDSGLGSSKDAAASSRDRSKTEATKDKDMNPNGPAVGRQREKYDGNARTIAETLADKGWNDHQIAGALGRLQQESSLNPNATRKNDNMKAAPGLRDSIGIAQWNGPRQAALKDYAAKLGTSWNDIKTQASFLDHEMKNSPDERRAYNAMQNSKTVAEAATAMMHYERPLGYSPKNPAGGHGYQNTQSYASAFAAGKGLKTSLGADADPQAVASTSTAHQTLGKNVTAQNSYVDPMVSTVASTQSKTANPAVNGAIGAIDGLLGTNIGKTVENISKAPEQRDRLGFGKIGELAKADDTLGVMKEVAKAALDPVGFALDSIEDGWNQSGGLKGLTGGKLDGFNFDFGGALAGGKGGGGGFGSSGGDSMGISMAGSNSSLFGVVGGGQTQEAALVPATPAIRKPFDWSKLT